MRSFLRTCVVKPVSAGDFETALGWNMVVPARVRAALAARAIDNDDVLLTLEVPLLVTQGRADSVVLPAMAEHVLATCPTAEASWYDDVGHAPHLEEPARFNQGSPLSLAASTAPEIGPQRKSPNIAGLGHPPLHPPSPARTDRRNRSHCSIETTDSRGQQCFKHRSRSQRC